MPRGEPYDMEVIERGEQYFVYDGLPHKEIASMLGVNILTVRGWARKNGWKSLRKEYRFQKESLKGRLDNIRVRLAEKAAKSLDYKDLTALLGYVKTTATKKEKIDKLSLFVEFFQELIKFMAEQDRAALEAVERNYDAFVGTMKEKYN